MIRSRAALTLLAALALLIALPSSAQEESDPGNRRAKLQQCRLLLRESLSQIESGEVDSALVTLRAALKCDPKNPDAFYQIGRVLLWQGDTTEAVSMLTNGVEKSPLSSRLKLLLARSMIARRNLLAASELLDAVLAIKPKEGEALFLKGVVSLEEGDTLQAIQAWESSLGVTLESAR